MKYFILISFLALAGCCRNSQPELRVVYRIPPEKQEAAMKMVEHLVASTGSPGYYPGQVYQSALEIAQKTYGEPIVVKP